MNKLKSPRIWCLSITLIMFGIPTAFAAEEAAAGGLASFIPLILIMFIFYFLLIRPQQKRQKEHRKMVEELKSGDKIVTAGGIYGTIKSVSEDSIKVEIADGVRVKIKRDTIANLVE